MHEYHVIKQKLAERLTTAGFREVVGDTDQGPYGSVTSIFASESVRVLIGWDREDREEGVGYAEIWKGNNTWQALETTVPEGSADSFSAHLNALAGALSCYI